MPQKISMGNEVTPLANPVCWQPAMRKTQAYGWPWPAERGASPANYWDDTAFLRLWINDIMKHSAFSHRPPSLAVDLTLHKGVPILCAIPPTGIWYVVKLHD